MRTVVTSVNAWQPGFLFQFSINILTLEESPVVPDIHNTNLMNKSFFNGPKIEIGREYIRLKKRNIRLTYQDIKLISIKNARIERAWLLYIIAGLIGLLIILYLFYQPLLGKIIYDLIPALKPVHSLIGS